MKGVKHKLKGSILTLLSVLSLSSCSESKRLAQDTSLIGAEIAAKNTELNAIIDEEASISKSYQSIRYKSGKGESTVALLQGQAKKLETEVAMLMTEKERAQAEVDELRKSYEEYIAVNH